MDNTILDHHTKETVLNKMRKKGKVQISAMTINGTFMLEHSHVKVVLGH